MPLDRRTQRPPRIGLALAGGGPLGAIYEIGALCAMEEAITGLDFRACHGFIGVSAGGFIAAGLANGLSPREQCAAFIENTAEPPDLIDPSLLLHPAWGEFARRLSRLPTLVADALWMSVVEGRSMLGSFERLGRVLPTGMLSGDAMARHLHEQFSLPGRTDDFRQLKQRLVLVATDLDSGEAVPFGMPGWDHVPISKAVQASAALPGLFVPVGIDGRHYVDGALKKTVHASVLLDEGLDLLFCLNPLVPYRAAEAAPEASARAKRVRSRIPKLVDGGMPVVMSQTFRSLIHSRLELGMRGYKHSHPNTDILLFEPDPNDSELFLANTFSYAQRRHLAEHAYQSTREQLLARADTLVPKLRRHGLDLQLDWLREPGHHLITSEPPGLTRTARALARLDRSLRQLESRYL